MEQKDLLDYVKREHDRFRTEARDSGFTKWAIFGALVFLVVKAINQYEVLLRDGTLDLELLPVLCIVSLMCVGGAFIGIVLQPPTRAFSLGWRIAHEESFEARVRSAVGFFFVLFLPLCLHVAYLLLAYKLGAVPKPTGRIYFALVGGTCFLSFLGALYILMHLSGPFDLFDSKDLPSIGRIKFTLPDHSPAGMLSLLAICSAAFFIGLMGILQLLIDYDAGIADRLKFAGIVALVVGCVVLLLESYSISDQITIYSALERDIVLRDLTVDQIKGRLESELLDSEFGSWLGSKLDRARQSDIAAKEYWVRSNTKLSEIDALDPGLRHEIAGRVDEVERERIVIANRIENDCKALDAWLEKIEKKKGEAPQDPNLLLAIKSARSNLVHVISVNKSESDKLVAALALRRS